MTTIQDRLNYLIEQLEHNNARKFADKVGIDAGHLSRIRNGIKPIGKQLVRKVINTYPQVNSQWLDSGDGYPGDISADVIRTHYETIIEVKDREIKNLCEELEMQRKVIERLLQSLK